MQKMGQYPIEFNAFPLRNSWFEAFLSDINSGVDSNYR